MKTLVISLAILAISFSAKAVKTDFRYVITKTDTIICQKLNAGLEKTVCHLNNGVIKVIPNKDIQMIALNIYTTEKKASDIKSKKIRKTHKLNLVRIKNESHTYRCEYFNTSDGPLNILISFYKNNMWINSIHCLNVHDVQFYIDQFKNNDCVLSVN